MDQCFTIDWNAIIILGLPTLTIGSYAIIKLLKGKALWDI